MTEFISKPEAASIDHALLTGVSINPAPATPLRLLAEIPALAGEVASTRDHPNPGAETAPESKISQPGGSKPPTNITALHAVLPDGDSARYIGKGLRGRLGLSIRLVIEELAEQGLARELPDYPEDTYSAMCGWLIATYPHWKSTPWAEDIHEDLQEVHGTLFRLARVTVLSLACPRPSCTERVHAQAEGAYYECEAGHVTDHHAEIKKILAVQQGTLREISELLSIPVTTLREWKKQGLIAPIISQRPAKYSLEQVRGAALEMDHPAVTGCA